MDLNKMKPPITSAQVKSQRFFETINSLGKMADELRAEVEALGDWICKELYTYLNDDHIDTALRQYFGANEWKSIKCWIGLHRWFYSDFQPWRCCGRCKQEQTAHKCGASDQWVWRNA